MAEDWLADVRKYVADADEAVVSAIVKYLGIALRNRDSSLVSFTDKKETDRVRENFLKKKLGLTDDDATLDAAIANVGEQMKGDRTKNRVTVYYLLARHFGLLTLFGGAAGAVGGAGAAAAMAAVGGADGDAPKENPGASAAPLAAAGLAGASAAAPAAAAPPPAAAPVDPAPAAASPQQAYSGGTGDIGSSGDSGGGMGWLGWLLLALALAALLFFGLRYCSKQDTAVAPATDDTAISETVAPGDGTVGTTGTASAAAIPAGAGVVAADREGKPMLTVYFDTGKSDVSNDLTTAASSVKAYLDANPAATLAVSGYNDPTGNAAANAELSKNRAQSVKAALEKLGFAADRVVLEKPAEATTTGTDNSAARRVEVTVKG
jgi:outer membrane protein OmpA-like peptidoglycan-associated protein